MCCAPVFGVCAFPSCHLHWGQGHGSKAASCRCHPRLVKGHPRSGQVFSPQVLCLRQDTLPLGGPAGFQWTFFITSSSNCRVLAPFISLFALKEFRAPRALGRGEPVRPGPCGQLGAHSVTARLEPCPRCPLRAHWSGFGDKPAHLGARHECPPPHGAGSLCLPSVFCIRRMPAWECSV